MLDFDFYNPTRIAFGQGKIRTLDQWVPRDARVLVLYGGGSAKTHGTLDQVKAALGDRLVLEFGGIEANPTYETLMKAVAEIKAHELDFLLAVGGGSVIDGTKFVAAAVLFDGEPWDILTSHGAVVKSAMLFGSVLTLPATGSEMNMGSVVTRAATQDKLFFMSPAVYPVFSVLDPSLSFTLPPRQIANGVVDAFTHIAEQYLTYPVNARVQDRFAEGLLLTLIEIGPKLLENPTDYDLHANFMWTATLALNGLIGAGVPQDWATHMIGHEITALHGLDHAQTLAIILPAMLEERREMKREKLMQFGARVWNITAGAEDQRIEETIRQTRAFFERMGVKTRLSGYGITADAIPEMLERLVAHGMVTLGERGEVSPDVSRKVLQRAL